MKRVSALLLVIFFFSIVSYAGGRKYVIKSLNCDSIMIGGSAKTVGDSFVENEIIKWSSDDQKMIIQDSETQKIIILSKKAFDSRLVRTVEDYFQTVKLSTRGAFNNYSAKTDSSFNDNRIALVVGNSNYESLPVLECPQADALAVTRKLCKLGFNTYTYYDLSDKESRSVIADFALQARSYDVALVYYAGHGLSWNGNNYYIPVNVAPDKPEALDLCISDEYLFDRLRCDNRKTTLFYLDACRSQISFEGIPCDYESASVETPQGMAAIMSTQDGRPSVDNYSGSGNSPFASAFLSCVDMAGISVLDMATEMASYIYENTGRYQVAPVSASLTNRFYFKPVKHNTIQRGASTTNEGPVSDLLSGWNEKGNDYYYGRGVEKNPKEAVMWYRMAAEGGNDKGQCNLAYCYHFGYGVDKDLKESFDWYKKAGDQGNDIACHNLGIIYEYGNGVKLNYKEAFKWYSLAADKGNLESIYKVGMFLFDGTHGETDAKKAFKMFKKAADKGHAESNFMMGHCYFNGIGVRQDDHSAFECFLKGAQEGSDGCQHLVGLAYCYGEGIQQDYIESLKWFKKAANQGVRESMRYIGYAYDFGSGVDVDPKEALVWYTKAADAGDPKAFAQIARHYHDGLGVEPDIKKSIEFYIKSANLGDAIAMGILGDLYLEGKDVPEDLEEATRWYRKGAEAGQPHCQIIMGKLLYRDDPAEALRWFQLAYENPESDEEVRRMACLYLGVVSTLAHEKDDSFPFDYKANSEYFENGALLGDISCMYYLALYYEKGNGVEMDKEKALYWYTKAADGGHSRSQRELGRIMLNEHGNVKDALQWYLTAYGNPDVDRETKGMLCNDLGRVYCYGNLLDSTFDNDVKKGFDYFMEGFKAENKDCIFHQTYLYQLSIGEASKEEMKNYYMHNAKDGIVEAQIEMGKTLMYDFPDANEADVWLQNAYKNPQADIFAKRDALLCLGVLYSDGNKLDPSFSSDYKKAVDYFVKGAELGDMRCIYKLGDCYEKGHGVEKDFDKAMELYMKASESGYGTAMLRLGDVYYDGRDGVAADKRKGIEWYIKAASAGNKKANDKLKEMGL